MCCGHDANYSNGGGGGNGAAAAQSLIPGSSGMVLIRYNGGNAGESSWWAGNPPVRYIFGGSKPLGYVAQNHVGFFLDQYEGAKPMFILEPVATPEPVKAEVETEEAEVETEETTEEVELKEMEPEVTFSIDEPVIMEAAAPVLEVSPKRKRSSRK